MEASRQRRGSAWGWAPLLGLLAAAGGCASVELGGLYAGLEEDAGAAGDAGGVPDGGSGDSSDGGGGASDAASGGGGEEVGAGCATPLEVWPDVDGDGFGDSRAPVTRTCGPLAGHVTNAGDCNDRSPVTHPDAGDTPGDGVDQDCDGLEVCFADSDGDGARGDDNALTEANDAECDDPGEALITAPATDCDDGDASVLGGAAEVCDGLDNDCDGAVDEGEVCPCPAARFGGHAYLLCPPGRTWEGALAFCEAQGMTLATISDSAEGEFVNELVEGARSVDVWIGLNDRSQEGVWTWASGEPVTFTAWDAGEPNDGAGGEDCGLVMTSAGTGSSRARRWDDRPCGRTTYAALCEARD